MKHITIGLFIALLLAKSTVLFADTEQAVICDNNTGYCRSVTIVNDKASDGLEEAKEIKERISRETY